eukprot:UN05891
MSAQAETASVSAHDCHKFVRTVYTAQKVATGLFYAGIVAWCLLFLVLCFMCILTVKVRAPIQLNDIILSMRRANITST